MEDGKEILEMICLEITQRGAQVSILYLRVRFKIHSLPTKK